jgi:hypothetical protein
MSVTRYRSVEEMPPPWRDPSDPGNLRAVALMLALHRRFLGVVATPDRRVQRFRSVEEANMARSDLYRAAPRAPRG